MGCENVSIESKQYNKHDDAFSKGVIEMWDNYGHDRIIQQDKG